MTSIIKRIKRAAAICLLSVTVMGQAASAADYSHYLDDARYSTLYRLYMLYLDAFASSAAQEKSDSSVITQDQRIDVRPTEASSDVDKPRRPSYIIRSVIPDERVQSELASVFSPEKGRVTVSRDDYNPALESEKRDIQVEPEQVRADASIGIAMQRPTSHDNDQKGVPENPRADAPRATAMQGSVTDESSRDGASEQVYADAPSVIENDSVHDDEPEQVNVDSSSGREIQNLTGYDSTRYGALEVEIPNEPTAAKTFAPVPATQASSLEELEKEGLVSEAPTDESNFMKIYRVIRGDCLWRISRREYGFGSRWPVIYRANESTIKDPDLIYVDQLLHIPSECRPE